MSFRVRVRVSVRVSVRVRVRDRAEDVGTHTYGNTGLAAHLTQVPC